MAEVPQLKWRGTDGNTLNTAKLVNGYTMAELCDDKDLMWH